MSLEFELPLVSLIFMLIIIVVYLLKKKIYLIENRYFEIILLCSLAEVIIDTIIHFIASLNSFEALNTTFYPFINSANKILSILFVIIFASFLAYTLTISYEKFRKNNNLIRIPLLILILLFTITMFFTNVEIIKVGYVSNVIGSTITIAYIVVAILLIATLVVTIINFKKIDKRYLPIFLILLLLGLLYIVTIVFPGMIIYDVVLALMCYIMYFTIENPDVKMIEQLEKAREEADKANHAKSDFLSSMSHEIRTPLNAIVGFSQALMDEDLPEESIDEIKDIMSASNNLLEIVNGILDISKIEANKLEIIETTYNFNKICDDLIKLTTIRIGDKPITFKTNIDESIPKVLYGDSLRVKQVILNLLTNAAKYTKEGFIDFTISSVKKDNVCRLIISVEDTGKGIKTEDINKLFTKFQRVEEDRNTTIEGTGLGLAITKSLVEMMGGKVIVQSKYGEGSRFTIALDQIIPEDQTIHETKIYTEKMDFSNKKVLVVDDNVINLKVAERLLKDYKISIDVSNDGFDCIEKIKSGKNYDIILMDDMMPKLSGTETLERLKQLDNFNIPTIALTANAINGMKQKYLDSGFNDYLSKPIEANELNRVLTEFLNK